MKNPKNAPFEISTYVVLLDRRGTITDVQIHDVPKAHKPLSPPYLKGENYLSQCANSYRPLIQALLNREGGLISLALPRDDETQRRFVVVGVPVGSENEGGALLMHLDVTSLFADNSHNSAKEMPQELTPSLIQEAISAAFSTQRSPVIKSQEEGYSGRYVGIESLSPRQREVLLLIGEGKSNHEIADTLSCSLNTVKRHVTAVLQKLQLPNRTRAAMFVSKSNLARSEPRHIKSRK